MSKKHKSRQRWRPDIQSVKINKSKDMAWTPQDEFTTCADKNCNNLISRESGHTRCIRCRN